MTVSKANPIASLQYTVQQYARPAGCVVLGLDGLRRVISSFQSSPVPQPATTDGSTTDAAIKAAKPVKATKLSYDIVGKLNLTETQQRVFGTAQIITALYLGLKK